MRKSPKVNDYEICDHKLKKGLMVTLGLINFIDAQVDFAGLWRRKLLKKINRAPGSRSHQVRVGDQRVPVILVRKFENR
jgi:hypothetical protein